MPSQRRGSDQQPTRSAHCWLQYSKFSTLSRSRPVCSALLSDHGTAAVSKHLRSMLRVNHNARNGGVNSTLTTIIGDFLCAGQDWFRVPGSVRLKTSRRSPARNIRHLASSPHHSLRLDRLLLPSTSFDPHPAFSPPAAAQQRQPDRAARTRSRRAETQQT